MENVGLAPIALDAFGNQLLEMPAIQALTKHTQNTDTLNLGDPVGIHGTRCGEPIFLMPSSETHNALICRRCLMRISVPTSLKTYDDLASYAKREANNRETKRRALNEAQRQSALSTPDNW